MVEVVNGLLNYVVGDGATYTSSLKVYQGSVKTTSIDVYKQFQGAQGTSENVLMTTLSVPSSSTDFISFDFKYEDLIAGLTAGGAPVPVDDTQLAIGDAFVLTYIAKTDSGNSHLNRGSTKVAVSTRFAGTYTVIESNYIHPTAGPQGGWNGATVVVESVDPVTYHILANGPFSLDQDPDNEFYFTIDGDGNITIPKEYAGAVQTVWSADEVANCVDDPGELPDALCSESMMAIKDDVNGRDQLIMSHGYIRDSGTRQFYYKLEKQ